MPCVTESTCLRMKRKYVHADIFTLSMIMSVDRKGLINPLIDKMGREGGGVTSTSKLEYINLNINYSRIHNIYFNKNF